VGQWWDPPRAGAVVGPGSVVGWLQCLTRRYSLVLPEGCAGIVERTGGQRVSGVAFGELLFRLRPIGDEAAVADSGATARGATDGAEDLPAGAHAVRAPTDGIFYRKASPEASAFVELGTRVRAGQIVGLVEVMKTFNQIVYGGSGLPEEGEIVEIRCGDGAEVSAGQVLFVVR
jgi:biotin carboxyl carrier protein